MHWDGIILGAVSFLVIGAFHPLVIKGEYYFGVKLWPFFLLLGLGLGVLAVLLRNPVFRAAAGVTAFASFWSILELFHQRKRVEKGWYPANPDRKP